MEMRWDDDGWHFEAMDFLMAELLSQVPACATVQDDAADARIFTSPTQGADRSDDQDWRENVVPELRELFQSYVDVVIGDLARMRKEAETSAIDIPAAHGRAWIHTLNQARLALAAKHGISEDEIEARRRVHGIDKSYALLQIDLYGMLLGTILSRTEL